MTAERPGPCRAMQAKVADLPPLPPPREEPEQMNGEVIESPSRADHQMFLADYLPRFRSNFLQNGWSAESVEEGRDWIKLLVKMSFCTTLETESAIPPETRPLETPMKTMQSRLEAEPPKETRMQKQPVPMDKTLMELQTPMKRMRLEAKPPKETRMQEQPVKTSMETETRMQEQPVKTSMETSVLTPMQMQLEPVDMQIEGDIEMQMKLEAMQAHLDTHMETQIETQESQIESDSVKNKKKTYLKKLKSSYF